MSTSPSSKMEDKEVQASAEPPRHHRSPSPSLEIPRQHAANQQFRFMPDFDGTLLDFGVPDEAGGVDSSRHSLLDAQCKRRRRNHLGRPRNPYFLYVQGTNERTRSDFPDVEKAVDFGKIWGARWARVRANEDIHERWLALAREERRRHAFRHPVWVHRDPLEQRPRAGQDSVAVSTSARLSPVADEESADVKDVPGDGQVEHPEPMYWDGWGMVELRNAPPYVPWEDVDLSAVPRAIDDPIWEDIFRAIAEGPFEPLYPGELDWWYRGFDALGPAPEN